MEDQLPQSNTHPAPGHSSGSKTWLVVLLVIVLVAGTAAGVYYWQQQQLKRQKTELESQISKLNTQVSELSKKVEVAKKEDDETADWKTYSNKSGAYSLKYPPNYATLYYSSNCPGYDPNNMQAMRQISIARTTTQLGICGSDKASQMSFTSIPSKSSVDWDKELNNTAMYSNLTKSDVTINGVSGTKYSFTNTGNGLRIKDSKEVVLVFSKGNNQYQATYYQDDKQYLDDSNTFNTIVTRTWQF